MDVVNKKRKGTAITSVKQLQKSLFYYTMNDFDKTFYWIKKSWSRHCWMYWSRELYKVSSLIIGGKTTTIAVFGKVGLSLNFCYLCKNQGISVWTTFYRLKAVKYNLDGKVKPRNVEEYEVEYQHMSKVLSFFGVLKNQDTDAIFIGNVFGVFGLWEYCQKKEEWNS